MGREHVNLNLDQRGYLLHPSLRAGQGGQLEDSGFPAAVVYDTTPPTIAITEPVNPFLQYAGLN